MADEDTNFSDVDVVDYLPAVQLSDDEARLFQQKCLAGFAISLLIRAKFFLKEMYFLDNEKCMTYQPANSSKVCIVLDSCPFASCQLIARQHSLPICRQLTSLRFCLTACRNCGCRLCPISYQQKNPWNSAGTSSCTRGKQHAMISTKWTLRCKKMRRTGFARRKGDAASRCLQSMALLLTTMMTMSLLKASLADRHFSAPPVSP